MRNFVISLHNFTHRRLGYLKVFTISHDITQILFSRGGQLVALVKWYAYKFRATFDPKVTGYNKVG